MIAKQLACAAALAAVMAPMPVFAQQREDGAAAQMPQSRGPMKVERVHSGFMFVPDVKVTEIGHDVSTLVGGEAGWLADETMFYGGGLYFLVDGPHNSSMWYGGFVFQFQGNTDHTVGYSVKALLGGGQADLGSSTVYGPNYLQPANGYYVNPYHYWQPIFVAEPEANLLLRLGRSAHAKIGVGYRFVGSYWGYGYYGYPYYGYNTVHDLQGPTLSFGVQLFGGR